MTVILLDSFDSKVEKRSVNLGFRLGQTIFPEPFYRYPHPELKSQRVSSVTQSKSIICHSHDQASFVL